MRGRGAPDFPAWLSEGCFPHGASRFRLRIAALPPRGFQPAAGSRPTASAWACRRATSSPARQPGARPPAGECTDSTGRPLRAISQEVNELEFHVSPAWLSSRPQTSVGTAGTRSRTCCASNGSFVSCCGLSTASPISGITPSRQRRTSYRKIRLPTTRVRACARGGVVGAAQAAPMSRPRAGTCVRGGGGDSVRHQLGRSGRAGTVLVFVALHGHFARTSRGAAFAERP
jgi:hypothetical protein